MSETSPIQILGVYFEASLDRVENIEFITPEIVGFKLNTDNPERKFDLSFFATETLIFTRPGLQGTIFGIDINNYIGHKFYIEGKLMEVKTPEDPTVMIFLKDLFDQYESTEGLFPDPT